MDLQPLFAKAGLSVSAGHNAPPSDAPLSTDLVNAAIGILVAAHNTGIDVPDAATELAIVRNLERGHNALTALCTTMIARAEESGAAASDGLAMADVIAEERRIPKNDATNQVRSAVAANQFPNALRAFGASRISLENLRTSVATLTKLRDYYSDAEFPAVEAAVLTEAEGMVPAVFKKKCRSTLEHLDEELRRANNAATAKRRQQSFNDRGLTITLVEDGEFGANLWAHLPAEYARTLIPALQKKAEAIARAQRHGKKNRQAADLRIRLLDSLFVLATDTAPPEADDLSELIGDGQPVAARRESEPTPKPLAFPERSRQIWDTTSEDLGRTARLASRKLRELLVLRDGGCVFPMCTDPPEACIVHHIQPWEAQGQTDLRNLALLCSRHHPRAEHPPGDPNHWTIVIDARGIAAARPPRRIDPTQRLIYHPRLTTPICQIPNPGQAPSTRSPDSTKAPPRFAFATSWQADSSPPGPATTLRRAKA